MADHVHIDHPPAAGFVAYMKLSGELDSFARILYYAVHYHVAAGASEAFCEAAFFLSWWAYSFPLAALCSASLLPGEQRGFAAAAMMGYTLLVLLVPAIVVMFIHTVNAIRRNKICVAG